MTVDESNQPRVAFPVNLACNAGNDLSGRSNETIAPFGKMLAM
jgi:hypothetical protein